MAQGNYGGGYTPPNPANPYANTGGFGQAPPPKKSNPILWILGIVGGLGVLGALCCCGGSYFLFNTSMNVIANQTKAEIQGHPAVQEHIGTIESASADFTAAIEETQRRGDTGGDSHMVIHIKGSKGKGDVIGKIPQGGQRMVDQVLRLPDGKELPLN
ncbi:MAG TPA: hypothetical protein VKH44_05080 [Pirellulaceae bacterium]|nr:hypothetical protein [Pirellulaceae bacterium]